MPTTFDPIEKVFIEPIRSVLMVDDKFPRMVDLVKGSYKVNPEDEAHERLKGLLDYCHREQPTWLVDVHDGAGLNWDALEKSSLHKCDWLILDYELEAGDHGKRALKVIKHLAESQRFNMVVIYSALEEADVFKDIVVSLSSVLKDEAEQAVEPKWDDISAKFNVEIDDKLVKSLVKKNEVWLSLLEHGFRTSHEALGSSLQGLRSILWGGKTFSGELKGEAYKVELNTLKWLLKQKLDEAKASVKDPMEYSKDDSIVRWILVGNAFVTVVKKDPENDDKLLDKLREALRAWGPSANWLVISKMRADLEAVGIRPEREIFRNKDLQDFWLASLLNLSRTAEKRHFIEVLLERQMEHLTDHLRKNVTDFALDLLKHFKSHKGPEGQDLKNAKAKHNIFVSTKRGTGGKNLVPGHVFQIDTPSKEYWVCLSAACDLEPERCKQRDIKLRCYPWMPFVALKLHKIGLDSALEDASRGYTLFLPPQKGNDVALCLSIFKSGNATSNPVWEEFFAGDQGQLILCQDAEGPPEFDILRIKKNEPHEKPSSGDSGIAVPLSFEGAKATIIAQLRTDYAAVLSQRLNHHMARIGLDYEHVDPPKKESKGKSAADGNNVPATGDVTN